MMKTIYWNYLYFSVGSRRGGNWGNGGGAGGGQGKNKNYMPILFSGPKYKNERFFTNHRLYESF